MFIFEYKTYCKQYKIQSKISFTFKLRKIGKKNDDVMHKHDSVKYAQNCVTVHKKILA